MCSFDMPFKYMVEMVWSFVIATDTVSVRNYLQVVNTYALTCEKKYAHDMVQRFSSFFCVHMNYLR